MPNDFDKAVGGVQSFIPAEADQLLQHLANTEKEWADGAALFGPGGMHTDFKESKQAVIALQIRDEREGKKEKITDDLIKQMSRAHPTFSAYLDESLIKQAKWRALDAKRKRIEMRLKLLQYPAGPR